MWDLHSHCCRNIPGDHANLCSLLIFLWPGRHSTWVQACALTALLGRALDAFFLQEGAQGGFAGWALHRLKCGERRSSSSSGDNQYCKENFKKHTSVVTSGPRTLHMPLMGIDSLGPTCACSSQLSSWGRQKEAASTVMFKPQDLPTMQLNSLLLVAQNSGMKC